MPTIDYQYKLNENTYRDLIFKTVIIATVFLELILIYFFAVKNMGVLVLFLFAGLILMISIILDSRIGVIVIIGFAYSGVGELTGGGIFSVLLIYVIIAWLIGYLFNPRDFANHQTNTYIAIFTILVLISVCVAESKELAIEKLMEYLKSVIIYLLIINSINTKKLFKYTYLSIVIICTIISIYAIHLFFNSSILTTRLHLGERDPNMIAMIILTAIPLAASLIKTQSYKPIKLMILLCGVTIISTIFMTYSRGGILALGSVLLWIVYNERKNKFLTILIILSLFIAVYFFITEFSFYKNTLRLITKDPSFIQRLKLYKGGIKMFLENPIFGVGLNNFILWSTRYTGLVLSLYAHNAFLHIGAETGAVGLVFYFLIIASAFYSLHKSNKIALQKGNKELAEYTMGLKISLFGILITIMFISQHFSHILWIILGLSVALSKVVENEKNTVAAM